MFKKNCDLHIYWNPICYSSVQGLPSFNIQFQWSHANNLNEKFYWNSLLLNETFNEDINIVGLHGCNSIL